MTLLSIDGVIVSFAANSSILPPPSTHITSKRHQTANKPHPHDDTNIDQEEEDHTHDSISKVGIRCGHVSTPTAIVSTPLLGDFDADEHLDLSYIVVWSSTYIPSLKTLVVASDLEEFFAGTYGKGILDFSVFLPPKEQPWSQYMGSRGDNVFRMQNSSQNDKT